MPVPQNPKAAWRFASRRTPKRRRVGYRHHEILRPVRGPKVFEKRLGACPGSLRAAESGQYWNSDMKREQNCAAFLLAGALTVSCIQLATSADRLQSASPGGTNHHAGSQEMELRGTVVCLPEEMHRVHHTDLPTNHAHIYGFRTTNGVYYTLLRTKLSEALFADQRLREKELLLTGNVLPKSQIFDVTEMKSIRKGVVWDLYYYCDICAIKTIAPGPCVCCQAPVELVEKPSEPGAK
jgi:hypothetical protein